MSAAYCWAYGLVDNTWWFMYTFLPTRLGIAQTAGLWLFVALLLAVVTAAALLAAVDPGAPTYDFYAPTRVSSKTASMMLFWAVDFMVWWAWVQVVISMDSDAAGTLPGVALRRSPTVVSFNLAMIALLALVTAAVYVANGAALKRAERSSYRRRLARAAAASGARVTDSTRDDAADAHVATLGVPVQTVQPLPPAGNEEVACMRCDREESSTHSSASLKATPA